MRACRAGPWLTLAHARTSASVTRGELPVRALPSALNPKSLGAISVSISFCDAQSAPRVASKLGRAVNGEWRRTPRRLVKGAAQEQAAAIRSDRGSHAQRGGR